MISGKKMWKLGLFCATLAGLMLLATADARARCGSCDAKAISAGTGISAEKDVKAAATEAAGKAKEALGKEKAKLVLVFDAGVKDKAALLAGVASVFDAGIIHGCSAYSPLTQESNDGTVGVLALGGSVKVATAIANLEGGEKPCGERIGKALKEAADAKCKGKLLILFGSCHVPKDHDLTLGAAGVLGENFPIVGAAASKGEAVYYQGKLAEGKNNVGILLTGDFKCGFHMIKDNSPEGLFTSAEKAFKAAVGKDKEHTVLMLAFDCGGRRGKMCTGSA